MIKISGNSTSIFVEIGTFMTYSIVSSQFLYEVNGDRFRCGARSESEVIPFTHYTQFVDNTDAPFANIAALVAYVEALKAASVGGSVSWGGITGTLSAQTDLQTALNAKAKKFAKFIQFETVAELEEAVGAAVGGVITIPTRTLIMAVGDINFGSKRLFFQEDSGLYGTTSETVILTSTLADGVAFITAVGSFPCSGISFNILPDIPGAVPQVFNLNGITEPGAALDWMLVNIISTPKFGTIQNYSNAIFTLCAVIGGTHGVAFAGTFDSIVFDSCIFRNTVAGGTLIDFDPATVINRRIRFENTPFVVPPTSTGINLPLTVSIGNESYISKYCNFSGGGTYLAGVQPNDNKADFVGNYGLPVPNSAEIAEGFAINNATLTAVASTAIYYAANVPTFAAGDYFQRFTVSSSGLTYTGATSRYFSVEAVISMASGNNQQLFTRVTVNGAERPSSQQQVTTSGTGRSENVKVQTIVLLNPNDVVWVAVRNASAATNIVVRDINMLIRSES